MIGMSWGEIAAFLIGAWGASLSTYIFWHDRRRGGRRRKAQLRTSATGLLQALELTVDRRDAANTGLNYEARWTDEQVRELELTGAAQGGDLQELSQAIAEDLRFVKQQLDNIELGLVGNEFPWPDYVHRRNQARGNLMRLETLTGGQPRGWVQ